MGTFLENRREEPPCHRLRAVRASLSSGRFGSAVRQLASGRINVHLVDLEPVMGTRSLVGADGVHLEDSGFEVMASTFMAAIEAAFPVRGSFQ